jgi:predicted RNase H-like HicB family nuclease
MEQMLPIETEREEDGRWIAEITALPGVQVYGTTGPEVRSQAAAFAFRVMADRIEHGEPVPDEARDPLAGLQRVAGKHRGHRCRRSTDVVPLSAHRPA